MTAVAEEPVTVPGVARNFAVGVSQIFLQENWITGLLILAGIGVYSVPMAAMTALGTLGATAAARLVGLNTAHGLQGYCGALVGAAAWTTFGLGWPATWATLLGAAACPVVTETLVVLFRSVPRAHGPLPVLTAPFCIVSGMVALMARAVMPASAAGPAVVVEGNPAVVFGQAVLTGVGQVVFAESWIGGALILAGLFVAGWRVGLAGLLGSLLGTLTALATGTDLATLTHGLAGYSPCLTAIAVAAVFLRPSPLAWLLGLGGAVVTVGAQMLLAMTPIPVYTWPFIVVTWVVLAVWDGQRT